MGEGLLTLRTNIGLRLLVLLHVNPQAPSVSKTFLACFALVGFVPCVNVVVLLQQLVVIEPLLTDLTPVLIVPGMFALVMTETLGRGKTVSALVADVALLSVVSSLVNILQVAGGETFKAVRAGELLLVVVFGGHVL